LIGTEFEVPPPGPAFVTVTETLASEDRKEGGTNAISSVAPKNVAGWPFTLTIEFGRKPVPVTRMLTLVASPWSINALLVTGNCR
jgi:hypothetical protein